MIKLTIISLNPFLKLSSIPSPNLQGPVHLALLSKLVLSVQILKVDQCFIQRYRTFGFLTHWVVLAELPAIGFLFFNAQQSTYELLYYFGLEFQIFIDYIVNSIEVQ